MGQEAIHYSGIRDNYQRGTAGEFVSSKLSLGTELSVVSAYFTIHAYAALQGELEQIKHLRFLFGEPTFLGRLDRHRKEAKEFGLTERGLKISNQLSQKHLARKCADWIEEKVEVRSVKQAGLLHGKMYHAQNGQVADALLGSSNFTVSGLGLGSRPNVELNLEVDSRRDREDLLSWFNEWWSNDSRTEDVKEKVLQELTRLYADQTPEFIYYLTLFHVFRDFIEGEREVDDAVGNVEIPETKIWKTLFQFQRDGAKAAINKIKNLNGCILADGVGLGKTFTALAVIKYFELKNERALVLCPKKLRQNWLIYRENNKLNYLIEDRFRYDVLSHTDLSREKGYSGGIDLANHNWGNYDLLVIDESHNFRNNNRAGEEGKFTRYERLIEEIIGRGVRTKVLLLSATPVNNELSDLRNQISIIAGGDVTRSDSADSAFLNSLDLQSVQKTTRTAQNQFTKWAQESSGQRNSRALLDAIDGDFFKLLDGLSIARSRTQIERYYGDEVNRLGGFPDRPAPRSIYSSIDKRESFLSFEAINERISNLKLALYNPMGYLRADLDENIRSAYLDKILGGFTQEGRERILINMMKVNFLKRLESSIDSFRLTLAGVIKKIDILDDKFTAFEMHQESNPEIDYDSVVPRELDDPELEEVNFTVGGKRKFHLGHIDIRKWRSSVKSDRAELQRLLEEATAITEGDRDQKLEDLRREVEEKLSTPSVTKDNRQNRKLLIFTAFADTAQYLFENLQDFVQGKGYHIALVCGDGTNKTTLGGSNYDEILTNFSPISKHRNEQKYSQDEEEIDVLIATDCISEGQNLQDCDLLINYDIHWNPVRIIQRFGRIDRIGSRNKSVHLVNFWPVKDLDQYLKVKHRVETKMALVDLSASQTDNLLNDQQLQDIIEGDLVFRDQQLQRLKEEHLDLDELRENITLSDFSLDEFRLELLQFLEARKDELEAAGLGLYAVVPPSADNPIAGPGVLFCLRHRKHIIETSEYESASVGGRAATKINPLRDYYLVYVQDDGDIHGSFAQPKQMLNLFRNLAANHSEAFKGLCDLFNEQTQNGSEMGHYDNLAQRALGSIENLYKERALDSLLGGRDGQLPDADEVPTDSEDEYELVTWLAILSAGHGPQEREAE